ncbi:MAG: YcxB family protein [Oscillospiraceae bacterium]|nr:YcxB family protein [Oscillospiraceae bacterium]
MKITAASKYDRKTVTALARVNAFKKHNPKKRMILSTVLISFIVVISIYLLLFYDDHFAYMFLFLTAILLLMECYIYLLFPKIQYRSLGKFAETCHTFCFTDDALSVTSSAGEYNGTCSIAYSMLYQLMETSEYLFIFQTKRQVYIVDKSTVRGGTIDELRAKLTSTPGLRYIMCNY